MTFSHHTHEPQEDSFWVLSSPVNPLNLRTAARKILSLSKGPSKAYVIFRDVHGIVRCEDDEALRRAHQDATLVCPDGMPLVWIGRRKGFSTMSRVYGPDMMRTLMEATRDGSSTHFLYGGKEGVADALKATLEEKYPGMSICGTFCPPFGPLDPETETRLITQLSEAKPDFFWVGLSTPKQEIFMHTYLPKLDTKVMLGVGAAFDYLSGTVKEPPVWVQRSGFQWLYRIFSEPRRLLGRYLRTIPRFVWCLILSRTHRDSQQHP